MVYPYNGIPNVFSNKKEWTTNTCYNMEEAQKHYAKYKKSEVKVHILWFHLYEMSRNYNSIESGFVVSWS